MICNPDINSEFLGQAWNKQDKKEKAPHISLMSERFNDVTCCLSQSPLWLLNVNSLSLQMCRLIVSDIITAPCNQSRVSRLGKYNLTSHLSPLTALLDILEKWTAVADICRCLHNFNGVMQAILDNIRKTTRHYNTGCWLDLAGLRCLHQLCSLQIKEDLGQNQ